MTYFSSDNFKALVAGQAHRLTSDANLQSVYDKLLDLHKTVYPRIRNHNINIHPFSQQSEVISFSSAASRAEGEVISIPLFRSDSEADKVEGLMGLRTDNPVRKIEAQFHPVIEMRVTPEYFVVELIVAPDAQWDQQNMVGKLSMRKHRAAFHKLLQDMKRDYRLGFWNGTHLSDMHLTTAKVSGTRALDEWMDTFEAEQDWFRVGFWYTPEDEALSAKNIAQEVFDRVHDLYQLYNFILWTSNNNFRSQQKQQRPAFAYA